MGQTHGIVYKIEPIKRIQQLPDDNENVNGDLISKARAYLSKAPLRCSTQGLALTNVKHTKGLFYER
jgi:hypothetical protein